ncbi:MAG TPA: hypothetical protein VEJ88_00975, partial [Dissulfurispiraceae bacterium]|nr:hypothetical protein [Dissulfurispiraceae bacterium]
YNANFISLVDEMMAFIRKELTGRRPIRQPGTEEPHGDNGDNGNNVAQKAGKRKQSPEAPAQTQTASPTP